MPVTTVGSAVCHRGPPPRRPQRHTRVQPVENVPKALYVEEAGVERTSEFHSGTQGNDVLTLGQGSSQSKCQPQKSKEERQG